MANPETKSKYSKLVISAKLLVAIFLIAILFCGILLAVISTSTFFKEGDVVDASMKFSNLKKVNDTWYETCKISIIGDIPIIEDCSLAVMFRVCFPSFCNAKVVSMNPFPDKFAGKEDYNRIGEQKYTLVFEEDWSYQGYTSYNYDNRTYIGDTNHYEYYAIDGIYWRSYYGGVYTAELLVSWDDAKSYEKYSEFYSQFNGYVLPEETGTWNRNTDYDLGYVIYNEYLAVDNLAVREYGSDFNMLVEGVGQVDWNHNWEEGDIFALIDEESEKQDSNFPTILLDEAPDLYEGVEYLWIKR